MNSTESSTTRLGSEANRSLADAAEMLQLRLELAKLELTSDLESGRQMGIFVGLGMVASLVAVSTLTTTAAAYADRQLDAAIPWISIFTGVVLLLGGSTIAFVAYYRFRRNLVGFRETLAELNEDAVWLRETWEDAGR